MSEPAETQFTTSTPVPDASPASAGKDESATPEVAPAKAETVAKATADEPQNALTKQFTEQEWDALKIFRVC